MTVTKNQIKVEPNITRDFLHEHGRAIVTHINHAEYIYNGKHYYCGWQSPCKRLGVAGGWIVYNVEEEATNVN